MCRLLQEGTMSMRTHDEVTTETFATFVKGKYRNMKAKPTVSTKRWRSSKLDAATHIADPFIRCLYLRFNVEIRLILKESIPLPSGRNGTCARVGHTCNIRSLAESLRRHPISECSASTPDRHCWHGSAPGPSAPALHRLGPVLRRPAPP